MVVGWGIQSIHPIMGTKHLWVYGSIEIMETKMRAAINHHLCRYASCLSIVGGHFWLDGAVLVMNKHGYKQIFEPHYSLEGLWWSGKSSLEGLLVNNCVTNEIILSTQQAQLSLPADKSMTNKYVPLVLLKQSLTLLFSACRICRRGPIAWLRSLSKRFPAHN